MIQLLASIHITTNTTMIFTSATIKSLFSLFAFFGLLNHIRLSHAAAPITFDVENAPSDSFNAPLRHCANLASKFWNSSVETRVKIKFSDFDFSKDSEVLGFAQPSDYTFANREFMQIASAKAVLQVDLNKHLAYPTNNDVFVSFNPHVDWYLGTDGKVPSKKSDFVSACLHEVYHGLFFSGRTHQADDKFQFDQAGRFDQFVVVETAGGDCPISSYANDEKRLRKALTGNALWFRTAEKRIARLYAPNEWTGVSSLYHLDNRKNSKEYGFMRPSLGEGKAYHDLGAAVLGIQNVMRDTALKPMKRCGPEAKFEPRFQKDNYDATQLVIALIVGPIVLILVCIGACCFLRRFRRNRADGEENIGEGDGYIEEDGEPDNRV